MFDNTYITVDLDAIGRNIAAVAEKAGVPVMAVVKADAYGHGAVRVARYLEKRCAFFGVATITEALELRRGGIRKPILVLGPVPEDALPLAVAHEIRPVISSLAGARLLSAEAVKQGREAPFHFALDTGMSRIGFQVTDQAADHCAEAAKLPGLLAEGLFSHFATADCAELSRAKAQAALFDRFRTMLEQRGLHIPICHMNNSAGVMRFTRHYDMVRSGIATYGMYPSSAVDPASLTLTPALSWRSRISHLQLLPPGREIGYGGTSVTTRPTLVATVPTGYADGYCWSLSGKFYVLIHDQRVPILGRICMDQMMVDVTGLENPSIGDEVVLLGTHTTRHISAEEIAGAAGSFHYEFVCGISRRVPRYYYENGTLTETVRYLLEDPADADLPGSSI